jgi:hypothetical protein
MFHDDLAPASVRRDISVPLSRTRIPFSVLQERLCSVYAGAAFLERRGRVCAVKVKLTIGFGIGGWLLWSAGSIARRFSPGSGEMATQAASNSLVIVRGGVGMSPGALREKVNKGGLSQSPPFFIRRTSSARKSIDEAVRAIATARDAPSRPSCERLIRRTGPRNVRAPCWVQGLASLNMEILK